jgi:peptide-methionine (R)-S-oxide reductase
MTRKIVRTEEDWRRLLDPHRYHILREAGTEPPFTGAYWNTDTAGTYVCGGCQTPLFHSRTKYHSGCGWPSFFDDLGGDVIEVRIDRSHRMIREEIVCRTCGGHLGHVFPDGPAPTGRRYCVNSASIQLIPD